MTQKKLEVHLKCMKPAPSFASVASCHLSIIFLRDHVKNGLKTGCPEFDQWLRKDVSDHPAACGMPPDYLLIALAKEIGYKLPPDVVATS